MPVSISPLLRPGAVEHGHDLLPPTPPSTVGVIEAIATGSPELVVPQASNAARVAALFTDPVQQQRIPRIYAKTRINTRHLVLDPLDPEFLAFSRQPGTIRDRMNLFFEHGAPLAIDVVRRAIAGLDDPAEEIGQLIFVTSTGFIAPGIDVAVIKELGLSKTVNRLVINFMGCAAAMNGIRAASDYVKSHPDKKSLVLCIELSSVNAVFDDDVNDVITHSLFGDGCAAVVIGARSVGQPLDGGSIVIRDGFSHLLDDAEDGIVLGVKQAGITCELATDLPDYIYRGVDPVIVDVLARNDLGKDDIDLWAIHPGGPRIIEESANSLGISPDSAPLSWEVLGEYGNMLSVSLLFVLQRMVAEAAESHRAISTGVAFSFAPGVVLEGIVFDVIGS
ncbi:alpha-pyrone synthesis polyketide synthase-like Pks18 [Nocardia camponoti]|uniref:Alpha-pyrone synthesis polyketide synthase-like Pks18 n=1 Tax=Nocardia camponoti TaxID=1616106 RepID=A0A917V4D9_9NOCA|nr:3-oxoacyl-[acyl-carrier-protein] synthase III C-terminal domain-containing protein [Nocardia camponoti]GGK34998.1 alpha-pyrone synthesis polyketide synthase-like Pks18 [Nocardia camponoti]